MLIVILIIAGIIALIAIAGIILKFLFAKIAFKILKWIFLFIIILTCIAIVLYLLGSIAEFIRKIIGAFLWR